MLGQILHARLIRALDSFYIQVVDMLKLFANITLIAGILAVQLISAASVDRNRTITFEGTLLNYSSHSGIACGGEAIYQVAKYRVDKILDGKYSSKEIVVHHLACAGDIFKNLSVGSRVKINVDVRRNNYRAIMKQLGIREEDWPKILYVAVRLPEKIVNH